MARPYRPPPGLELDYGSVIKDSLRLVWRNRILWLFGFFAGSATAFGGWSCDYNSYFIGPGSDESASARELARSLADWAQAHMTLIAVVVAAGLVAAIAFWLLSILCHGAVVASVRDIEAGGTVGFGSALSHGRVNYRRLFPYMLLFTLAPLALALVFAGASLLVYFLLTAAGDAGYFAGLLLLVALGAAVAGILMVTLGYLALLGALPLLAIMLFLAFNFGSRGVVLRGLGAFAAAVHGIRLLLDNLLRCALLYAISAGISIGSSIVLVFALLLASIPALAAWVFTFNAGMPVAGVIASVLLTLPPVVVLFVAAAGINTYFTVYWTESWLLFTGEKRHDRTAEKHRK